MFSGFFKWQHNHSPLTPTSAVLWVSPDKFLAPREVKTLRGCLDTNKSSQNSAEEQSWNLLCHALNQSMAHWSKLCSIDSRWVSGPLLLPFVQKGTILTATRRLYSCCKILLFLYFKSSVVTKLLFAAHMFSLGRFLSCFIRHLSQIINLHPQLGSPLRVPLPVFSSEWLPLGRINAEPCSCQRSSLRSGFSSVVQCR